MKHYNNSAYKFCASPKGRKMAARFRAYKVRVVKLYCIIGVLAAVIGVLSIYIYKISNGG